MILVDVSTRITDSRVRLWSLRQIIARQAAGDADWLSPDVLEACAALVDRVREDLGQLDPRS